MCFNDTKIRRCIFIYYKQIQHRQQQLASEISSIRSQLREFPEGSFFCTFDQKTYRWYHSLNGKKIYIPKSNRTFAETMATKKYLSLLLEDLVCEEKSSRNYLQHPALDDRKSTQLLANSPEYQKLLHPHFQPASADLSTWASASYQQNTYKPEQRIHKSISGNFVRSKSEFMIDTYLFLNKLPYRYECALLLNGHEIFPDFTIRHPKTGELYYWEHFGMMDDPSYQQHAISKLALYSSNGIIPSIHLITTYETKDHPLDAELVEKIIQHYFF